MANPETRPGNQNYQKRLDEVISSLPDLPRKPALLLHACCAPCSSYVLEYLAGFFSITVYYYNPNIYPPQEYLHRLNETRDFYARFPPAFENDVRLVEADYNPDDFYAAIDVQNHPERAHEAEKGERCRLCYRLRLERSFRYACQHNFDYFCTTLSISPFKDAQKINEEGIALALRATENHPKNSDCRIPAWLFSDFKKKGGFKRSLELSAEFGLYRQNYCGCVYSREKQGNPPELQE